MEQQSSGSCAELLLHFEEAALKQEIDAYIKLKMAEVTKFRMSTHPVEFDMYYSL